MTQLLMVLTSQHFHHLHPEILQAYFDNNRSDQEHLQNHHHHTN